MPGTVLVGMQWGDEGKAKVVDAVINDYDVVVRYQGGPNAGHTIVVGDTKFVCHQVPSGILTPRIMNVLGNGMVVNPPELLEEIVAAEKLGADRSRILISDRATVILQYHIDEDKRREKDKEERTGSKIGTTGRGIGPAYESKYERTAVFMGDLLYDKRLKEALGMFASEKPGCAVEKEYERLAAVAEVLSPMITDTGHHLNSRLEENANVLFEGAQGTMLDVDHGHRPYVTSSNATAGGACTGSGVSPTQIKKVIGIMKAYATRVGSGPFPTELKDDEGERLRQKGNEFGATTGRPRRCGWQDLMVAKYACRVNGVTEIALTKLDVLDDSVTIPVCTGYWVGNRKLSITDPMPTNIEGIIPIFNVIQGWSPKRVAGVTELDKMPEAAMRYVEYLQKQLNVPITLISTGADRDHTIRL